MPVRLIGTCAVMILAMASAATAAQQHRGSEEDQAACTPDVYSLCSQYIPDEDDIVACLERKKAQLSPACHEVFSRPGNPPAKAAKPDDDED